MTEAAQEDLTGMPTPVDVEEEQYIRLCRALGLHPGLTEAADVFEAAVKAVNGHQGLLDALTELVEVADLRGDSDIPAPPDDPKLWSARMATAWDEARSALSEVAGQ